MKDLAHDTIHNFDPKYDHYVAQIVDADGNMLTPEVGGGPDILEAGDDIEQANGAGNDCDDGEDRDHARTVSVRSRPRTFPRRGVKKVPTQATLYADIERDAHASTELSIEEQQAMERAWAAQEARLRAELDTDRVAESSLKQQAMRLPLHKRRKGGYTRSIPTTYAIAGDNTESAESDSGEGQNKCRSSSSSISDDDLPNAPSLQPHRTRGKGKVRRVQDRLHRRPARKTEGRNSDNVPAVAHAAMEHLEAALAAVDISSPDQGVASDDCIGTSGSVEQPDVAPELDSVAQVGVQALNGKSTLVGLAQNRNTRAGVIDQDDGDDEEEAEDDEDDDEYEYDFNLPQSDDEPSSDELDLGLGLAGSADEL